MPHFIIKEWNGRRFDHIEFFHDQSVDHSKIVVEIPISNDVAALGLTKISGRYHRGLSLNFSEMG